MTSKTPDDSTCGFCGFKPRFLQICNNPKAAIFWIGSFAFVLGFVVNGVNNVNVTSLERRFGLSSTEVGWISSMYDLTAGILALPITYWGTHGHQPRIMGIVAAMTAMGSFVMTLPHFATGRYELAHTVAESCQPAENNTACELGSSGLSSYLYVFLLGQLLNGAAGTTLFTLGIVYIDSNVKSTASPIYQSIIFTCSTVGPAVGFLVGGSMLELYVDFDTVDTSQLSITSSEARWVGAWWIGFLISGFFMIIVAVGIWPFPKEMPAGLKTRQTRKSEAHQNGSEEQCLREGFMTTWKDGPVALKLLLTNPVLVFTTMASVTEGIVLVGFATFLPKIIQNQFYETSSRSALFTGFISVPGGALGSITGAGVVRLFKLKVRGQLRMCVTACILCAFTAIISLARCKDANIAGVNIDYSSHGVFEGRDLTSGCNAACGCSTWSYEPVCGVDGVQYFSPCHAGCAEVGMLQQEKIYMNCSCIDSPADEYGAKAYKGSCEKSCDLRHVFLFFFFFVIFLTFFIYVPAYNVSLRSIPHVQRSFGLGVQSVFTRLLGTTCGPLLFGYAFDQACVIWQERCQERGSCWIYDNQTLSVSLLVVSLVIKSASAMFYALALCCYQPPLEDKLVFQMNNTQEENRQ